MFSRKLVKTTARVLRQFSDKIDPIVIPLTYDELFENQRTLLLTVEAVRDKTDIILDDFVDVMVLGVLGSPDLDIQITVRRILHTYQVNLNDKYSIIDALAKAYYNYETSEKLDDLFAQIILKYKQGLSPPSLEILPRINNIRVIFEKLKEYANAQEVNE